MIAGVSLAPPTASSSRRSATGTGGAYNSAMGTVREVLNRLRWGSPGGTGTVVLSVRVREGGVERIEEIGFDSVVDILPLGITVASGAFLPYHRIVDVRRDEEVLWLGGKG